MSYSPDDLEMALRHVDQGEGHVRRQREIIAQLAAHGLPTTVAEELLQTFEATLRTHREHMVLIRADVEAQGG